MNLTSYIRQLNLIFANLTGTVHEFKPTSLNLYFTERYGVGRTDMVLMTFEMVVQYWKHINSTLKAGVRQR